MVFMHKDSLVQENDQIISKDVLSIVVIHLSAMTRIDSHWLALGENEHNTHV